MRDLNQFHEFITVKEVAKIIRLKPDTIYKKVGKNQMPFHKVGGKVLFEKNELFNWVRLQKHEIVG